MIIAPDDPIIDIFTDALNIFNSNPVCAVTDIRMPWSNANPDTSNFRRGLDDIGGTLFIEIVTLTMIGQAIYSLRLQYAWDNIMGPIYNFYSRDFQQLYRNFAEYDPIGLTAGVFCNIQNAANVVGNSTQTQNMCESATATLTTKRSAAESTDPLSSEPGRSKILYRGNEEFYHKLAERIFGDDLTGLDSNPAFPLTSALLQAVINNELPLLYIRQLFYVPEQDLNLEVVFDLTNHPELRQEDEDIFAVFHFHTRGLTENGWPQIYYFHVFHGQYVDTQYAEWFVDGSNIGNYQPNQRTPILRCPYAWNPATRSQQRTIWIPSVTPPIEGDDASQLIYDFGVAMVEGHVLDHSSFFFTESMMNGRSLMTWDDEAAAWNFNGLVQSSNFGPGGADNPSDMSPAAGWPQLP